MIKIILIAVLAVTTLGFLGATIGLAVTRNKSGGGGDVVQPPTPHCDNVSGYVVSFLNLEDITEQYIDAVKHQDAALLTDMMTEGKPFEDGKLVFAKQADVISGAIAATNHLGKDCDSPGKISGMITERLTLVDDYSRMTYKQFLASQGIYD